jgi:hypothetical protein
MDQEEFQILQGNASGAFSGEFMGDLRTLGRWVDLFGL